MSADDPDRTVTRPNPVPGPATGPEPDTRPAAEADPAITHTSPPESHPSGTLDHSPSCGLPGGLAPGRGLPFVPGYEVEAEIARGGMGVVYRARHVRLNRPTALKMLLGGKYHDPAARVRFLVEAEAVAALQHPHVVQVFEFGEYDDLPFLAMEFVGGGTLADKVARDGRVAPRPAAELMAKLAAAIAFAHSKGIVHRDLKPANVMLTPAGEPKVTDFGLAKVGDSGVTASGAVMGTPSYMAPEQAAGKVREVGTHSDVYALGTILYELLTGRPPFRGDSAMGTLQQVMTREPDRPRALIPTVPRDLETVCLKCLEKNPRRRYPTADALAADLRAYLDGRPITARPVGPLERAWKWARRHPGRASVLVAGLLLVTVGLVAANEARKFREEERLQARADALVEALTTADIASVGPLLEELDAVRDRVRPRLRELATLPVGSKPGLHARLALLPEKPGLAPEVADFAIHGWAYQLLPVREQLVPHAAAVAPRLWSVVESPVGGQEKVQIRAACMLAGMAPDDPRWRAVGPRLGRALVDENPIDLVTWNEALEPVRAFVVPGLIERYRQASERIGSGKLSLDELADEARARDTAVTLIAEYAIDQPEPLVELALTADARHFEWFRMGIERHRDDAVRLLRAELAKAPAQDWAAVARGEVPFDAPAAVVVGVAAERASTIPDAVHDALARRQAGAAAVLLRLGDAGPAWRLLRHSPDPTARSHLVGRLAAVGAEPVELMRRFRTEADVSARRALVVAFGDFGPRAVPAGTEGEREGFANELLALYRAHPDPGLHSAIDWLLRQKWGKAKELADIDAALAGLAKTSDPVRADRDWFVNRQGQTYAVIRGPIEFVMGSPPAEPRRDAVNEPTHRKRIGRSFAVATKEVTVEQFLRFRPKHTWAERYSPDRDSPAVSLTWYEAVAYCNWLSEAEGIPPDQWCYEPVSGGVYGQGMVVKPGHLSLKGYRLPTEAEWEYACRAGSAVSRYYGRSESLLPRYGWFLKTADDRAWPVGRLRPNDLGLFDVLGNAWEWVADPSRAYDASPNDGDLQSGAVSDRDYRVLRGGSFSSSPSFLRCADRDELLPSNRLITNGVRPARTLP
jgi:formylglycine-generating enzyme required for sulfatase activity/tRNA A-37 threonylcarbamoyl transferase component Bud32